MTRATCTAAQLLRTDPNKSTATIYVGHTKRQRDSTAPLGIGWRHPVVCPVMFTMEWAMTGQKIRQHGLASRPFICFWTLLCGWDTASLAVSGICHMDQ